MSDMSRVIVHTLTNLVDHPNADSLAVGHIDGCPFVVNKFGLKNGDSVLFCCFDTVCPDTDQIPEWIRGKRIKPTKPRGIFSMGACIPNTWGFAEGFDATDVLGFTRYEPPELSEEDSENPPSIFLPKYDINSLRAYHNELSIGWPVLVTEKIHGENICITYQNGLHVRSHTRWKKEVDNHWWRAVKQYNWEFLKENPGIVLIGEKYGKVKHFKYGMENGKEKISIFDVYDSNTNRFYDIGEYKDFIKKYSIDIVPELTYTVWAGLDDVKYLAEEPSVFGGIREGIVVKQDGQDSKFGRRIYKLHGEAFMVKMGKQ